METSVVPFVLSVIDQGQLQTLAYGVGGNLILGVLAALVRDKFELVKLINFWKRVITVFGSYVAVSIAAKGFTDLGELRTAIWLALLAYLLAQILANLQELTGITIPEKLQRWIER